MKTTRLIFNCLVLAVAGITTAVLWSGCSTPHSGGYNSPPQPLIGKTYGCPSPLLTGDERKLVGIPATDEIWIIEKPAARPAGTAPAARPDLLAAGKNGELIPIPLQHSSYEVKVAGILAETHVRQTYANPFTAKIEATYVFPLPDDAAVTDFLMIIGQRKIRGIIREREEAKQIYEEAKRQGYVAALLTEERPNIFTQKIANIEPGKQIDVEITYFNTAKYLDGEFELALPTVVGPRYNPAGTTNGIDAVPRGKGCKSPQAVAIEYLAPNERSGHMIDVTVELDPQVTLERIASSSHEIATQSLGDGRSRITLKAQEMVPNRDFILRWRPAGKPLQTAFWIGGDEKERTFALLLMPPASEKELPRQPREMIFIVDRSGSMSGRPMAKVQEAMRNCLNGLDGHDTFQIVEFSNQASSFGPEPVPATETNLKRAIDYVNRLDGNGGTEVAAGLKCAFGIPHDPKKLRIVSIMTDGYIGNEMQILTQVQEQLGDARIFAFGVGNSVNRYLIESLAKVGHGAAAFVGLNEDSGTAVGQFYRRAAYPALTEVAIEWGGLQVDEVFPKHLPDLFVGRPVLVTGRLVSAISKDTRITIAGTRGGETVRAHLPVSSATIPVPAVCHIWAKHKIAQLMIDNAGDRNQEFQKSLTEFSINHTVLCPYTAFLAVDASRITEGNAGYSVNVPVPVPDGVRYDTTVLDPGQRKN
jgi:Ca-activated chloride channel family protein